MGSAHAGDGAAASKTAASAAAAASTSAAGPQRFREVGDAVAEVAYSWRFGERNERFWRRMDTALALVNAFAGSATFASWVSAPSNPSAAPWWLWIGPALVSLASIAQLVLRPAERANAFSLVRRDLYALEVRAWGMDVQAIDAERRRLTADAPRGINSLSPVARNDLVYANGRPTEAVPLTAFQRLMEALA